MSQPRLLLTTDVVGGVWDFCVALASAIDWRVTLLALGQPSPDQRAQAESAGIDLVSVDLKLEWMQDSARDVDSTRTLLSELIRRLQPDLVHANQFAAACVQADVPIVLTVHSDVLSWRRWTLGTRDTPTEWQGYAEIVQSGLRCADAVVAVSRFLARETRSLYTSRRPIEVIYNGWAAPGVAVPKEDTTLLAGRIWDAAKNISLAAEAAVGWDVGPVFLAGDQRHPESGSVAEVGRPLRVLGQLSRTDMHAWLARSSIFLSPARYDPFGLLPLQAALAGCALLLSDIPSYRELWDDAAAFFRSDDAADLREQWSRLRSEPDTVRQLGAMAHARALERYSVERMANAYSSLYADMAASALQVPA